MKGEKCFYYQQPRHIIANYPKSIIKAISVVEIAGIAIDNSKILGKK